MSVWIWTQSTRWIVYNSINYWLSFTWKWICERAKCTNAKPTNQPTHAHAEQCWRANERNTFIGIKSKDNKIVQHFSIDFIACIDTAQHVAYLIFCAQTEYQCEGAPCARFLLDLFFFSLLFHKVFYRCRWSWSWLPIFVFFLIYQ